MANKLADWLEALADPEDATREEAAQALIKLADPAATDALIEALQDDYWSVRMHASHALARIGGSRGGEAPRPLLGGRTKKWPDGAAGDFPATCAAAGGRRAAGPRGERRRVPGG